MADIKPLKIEATSHTPEVNFDPELSVYEITGRAMYDDVQSVHNKTIKWVDENLKQIKTTVSLHVKMNYVDSSATKMLLILLSRLEEAYMSGQPIDVRWYYNIDDEDIISLGEKFIAMKKLPIEMIGVMSGERGESNEESVKRKV